MTRSLFAIEDEDGDLIRVLRSREEAKALALCQSATPKPRVVEYVPRPRWIPVGEKLPEPGEPVLVHNAAGFIGGDAWTGEEWVAWDGVTHWQPLPAGPEEA